MARNLSVQQFQQLMARLPKAIVSELQAGVQEGGEMLASGVRQAVPKGVDGRNELLESVRVEPGRRPLQVLVRAGGPLTTKEVRKGSSVTYDYANANEFGTQKMAAQPFFWPSYRFFKNRVRALISKRAKAAIGKVVPLS